MKTEVLRPPPPFSADMTQIPATVGIVGREDADQCLQVLSALAQSCGLNVRRAHINEENSLAGLIIVGPISEHAGVHMLPTIRIFLSDAFNLATDVRFDTGASSPFSFSGRSVVTGSAIHGDRGSASGEVIATAEGKPIWTSSVNGGLRHDTCLVSRPWIREGDCAFDHLNGSRFMSLLPVLEWLRSVSDYRQWQRPQLRACFMFDDPNLHGTRYGHVDFAKLAAEGRRHHYHTSFATVPLDSYYVNSKAATLFRDNRDTLSLLIHGNNHTYRELARRGPKPEQLALMEQSVLRTNRLEKQAGVDVSRVMAPPHGVCSDEMMVAMRDAGIEAACVSHGSVRAGNPGAYWTVALGTLPAAVVAGLPVIPRFGLDRTPENQVLLAAYLDQPIIPVGHHWDLADGMEIMAAAATCINTLGCVEWGDMTSIARGNYRSKVQGELIRVRAFSRKTVLTVPQGVSEVEFEAPWLDPVKERPVCQTSDMLRELPMIDDPSCFRFSVDSGSSVTIDVQRRSVNETLQRPPRTPFSAIARRVLAEIRDRSMPYLPRRLATR